MLNIIPNIHKAIIHSKNEIELKINLSSEHINNDFNKSFIYDKNFLSSARVKVIEITSKKDMISVLSAVEKNNKPEILSDLLNQKTSNNSIFIAGREFIGTDMSLLDCNFDKIYTKSLNNSNFLFAQKSFKFKLSKNISDLSYLTYFIIVYIDQKKISENKIFISYYENIIDNNKIVNDIVSKKIIDNNFFEFKQLNEGKNNHLNNFVSDMMKSYEYNNLIHNIFFIDFESILKETCVFPDVLDKKYKNISSLMPDYIHIFDKYKNFTNYKTSNYISNIFVEFKDEIYENKKYYVKLFYKDESILLMKNIYNDLMTQLNKINYIESFIQYSDMYDLKSNLFNSDFYNTIFKISNLYIDDIINTFIESNNILCINKIDKNDFFNFFARNISDDDILYIKNLILFLCFKIKNFIDINNSNINKELDFEINTLHNDSNLIFKICSPDTEMSEQMFRNRLSFELSKFNLQYTDIDPDSIGFFSPMYIEYIKKHISLFQSFKKININELNELYSNYITNINNIENNDFYNLFLYNNLINITNISLLNISKNKSNILNSIKKDNIQDKIKTTEKKDFKTSQISSFSWIFKDSDLNNKLYDIQVENGLPYHVFNSNSLNISITTLFSYLMNKFIFKIEYLNDYNKKTKEEIWKLLDSNILLKNNGKILCRTTRYLNDVLNLNENNYLKDFKLLYEYFWINFDNSENEKTKNNNFINDEVLQNKNFLNPVRTSILEALKSISSDTNFINFKNRNVLSKNKNLQINDETIVEDFTPIEDQPAQEDVIRDETTTEDFNRDFPTKGGNGRGSESRPPNSNSQEGSNRESSGADQVQDIFIPPSNPPSNRDFPTKGGNGRGSESRPPNPGLNRNDQDGVNDFRNSNDGVKDQTQTENFRQSRQKTSQNNDGVKDQTQTENFKEIRDRSKSKSKLVVPQKGKG